MAGGGRKADICYDGGSCRVAVYSPHAHYRRRHAHTTSAHHAYTGRTTLREHIHHNARLTHHLRPPPRLPPSCTSCRFSSPSTRIFLRQYTHLAFILNGAALRISYPLAQHRPYTAVRIRVQRTACPAAAPGATTHLTGCVFYPFCDISRVSGVGTRGRLDAAADARPTVQRSAALRVYAPVAWIGTSTRSRQYASRHSFLATRAFLHSTRRAFGTWLRVRTTRRMAYRMDVASYPHRHAVHLSRALLSAFVPFSI